MYPAPCALPCESYRCENRTTGPEIHYQGIPAYSLLPVSARAPFLRPLITRPRQIHPLVVAAPVARMTSTGASGCLERCFWDGVRDGSEHFCNVDSCLGTGFEEQQALLIRIALSLLCRYFSGIS